MTQSDLAIVLQKLNIYLAEKSRAASCLQKLTQGGELSPGSLSPAALSLAQGVGAEL